MKCPMCGAEVLPEAKYCHRCGSPINRGFQDIIVVTTPSIPGYRIRKVLGVVTGIVPRTRGFLGKIVASIQSVVGGEVSTFTSELEKARMEAIERLRDKARGLGANAVVGLDLETSDLGLQAGVVVVSATGTAVIAEPESESPLNFFWRLTVKAM